jgi:hypothetical protein
LSLALRAALWPNTSVLQLVAFPGLPGNHFTQAEVVELPVDEAGYAAALAFVAGTFTRAPDGVPIRLGPACMARAGLPGRGFFSPVQQLQQLGGESDRDDRRSRFERACAHRGGAPRPGSRERKPLQALVPGRNMTPTAMRKR